MLLGTYFNIGPDFATSTFGYAGTLFTDFQTVITMILGALVLILFVYMVIGALKN